MKKSFSVNELGIQLLFAAANGDVLALRRWVFVAFFVALNNTKHLFSFTQCILAWRRFKYEWLWRSDSVASLRRWRALGMCQVLTGSLQSLPRPKGQVRSLLYCHDERPRSFFVFNRWSNTPLSEALRFHYPTIAFFLKDFMKKNPTQGLDSCNVTYDSDAFTNENGI